LNQDLLSRVRELGTPEPHLFGSSIPPPTQEHLQEGRFEVYRRTILLKPPIDWRQDPYGSRSWCYQLHSLVWLSPLFFAYSKSGDEAALKVGLDVIADWISNHLPDPSNTSEFAWYDMAVSQRTPSFAYALRSGLVANLLDDTEADLLLATCERHGNELADKTKYSAGHNHGLVQDEALHLLSHQLPVLPAAPDWAELARNRMRVTLKATIDEQDGVHLEHSSAYQFAIASLVSRVNATMTDYPELNGLHERLRRTAAWHVTPAKRIAQLGDTDDSPAPDWATRDSVRQHGLKAFYDGGSAFVRSADSYLCVTCGYHSHAHKHSDDAGFLLVEGEQTVLGDAGRWGYYENEADRKYARSAHAHNVLTVDDQDFAWSDADPYGSGLILACEENGWYALLVRNPLLAAQGVRHRRLLLYRPASALIVIDDVKADEAHNYARHFHFGPGLAARIDGKLVKVTGRKLTAKLADVGENSASKIELVRGQDRPVRKGWTYPGDRERIPIDTVTLCSRGRRFNAAVALTFDDAGMTVNEASMEDRGAIVKTSGGVVAVQLDPNERVGSIKLIPAGRVSRRR
jgi:hypothetical protein